ncbi:MAG TPA: YciI family protein [Gemmatimonadales bacterium]|nr:YciI family protein [Gemmatimonadales bacterium]
MTDPTAELTPRERDALARLPRGPAPPAELEEATVAALRARGLLRAPSRRRRMLRAGLALAASVALFTVGVAVGRRGPAPSALPAAAEYMLLLYEGAEYRSPPPGRETERVREYSAWAGERAARGELVAGEKLGDEDAVVVGADGVVRTLPSGAGSARLAGFFVIRARDRARAVEIARGCPHVRYGGSIVVRRIEPT